MQPSVFLLFSHRPPMPCRCPGRPRPGTKREAPARLGPLSRSRRWDLSRRAVVSWKGYRAFSIRCQSSTAARRPSPDHDEPIESDTDGTTWSLEHSEPRTMYNRRTAAYNDRVARTERPPRPWLFIAEGETESAGRGRQLAKRWATSHGHPRSSPGVAALSPGAFSLSFLAYLELAATRPLNPSLQPYPRFTEASYG